jgi:hypothetical protein
MRLYEGFTMSIYGGLRGSVVINWLMILDDFYAIGC